jgi:aldose 1-epimerase
MALGRYAVRQAIEDGYQVFVLEDHDAQTRVWVCPALGYNAYRFSATLDGTEVAVLDPPPTLADLRAHPAWFGVPILFPFPGRVRQGRFVFRGRTYQMATQASGHASHGLVLDRPWQVAVHDAASGEEAALVGQFDSEGVAELGQCYPSAFRLEVTYSLAGRALTVEARAENTGRDPLPLGYGLHPYLRAPLSPESSRDECAIRVPVRRSWELEDDMPTGRILPLTEDFAGGITLTARTFDNAYTDLITGGAGCRCQMLDKAACLSAVVEADRQFREWVVYTPPRPAISFEPLTCVPNALNLTSEGIDAGLIVLEPGEWRRWRVAIAVSGT